MKYIQSYPNNKLRLCKFGLAAAVFFMGVLPSTAQDENDGDEAPNVEAVAKAPAKKTKNYPMKEVSGKVVDAATGEALAGVKVKSYNNSYYTAMTGEDGTFTIKVPTFVTSLEANLEGYNLVREPLNGRSADVNISLYTSRYISEYTSRTTASKQVGIDGFDTSTSLTADDEIHNRLGADVRSITRSAFNAQGSAMFIGGYNTLNSNAQPLIILDGVVYDMLYDSDMLHTGYFNDLLSTVNMDDIESIEVMKNGTAIYGAKAANGVISIKTKRNKSMATRIDFNAKFGMELTPKTIDMMGAEDYRSYASQMLRTTGTKLTEFKFLNNNPQYPFYNKYHNNTDWNDQVSDEAFTQQYSINIQGGDDVANYNLSVGYMDGEATLKKNDMNRFNIRFNTDILLNQWFTTRFDASYSNVTRNLRDGGLESNYASQPLAATNVLALMKSPFLSPYDFTVNGIKTDFISGADDYLQEVLGAKAAVANPTAILANGDAKNKNHTDLTQINLAIAPKWQPNKNFSLTEHFSYTMQSFDESYYTPHVGMPTFDLPGAGTIRNTKESIYTKHNAIFSDTRADWAIPLGAHRLDIFGGVRFMNDTYTSSDLLGYDTGTDQSPNSSSSLRYRVPDGTDLNWRSLSYYANVDYNYKEKYYLQGSFSMETSSRFGKEADAGLKLFGVAWGFFPSLQAAWMVSNEDWFHTSNLVNSLKINAGFESLGNDNIDNMATVTYMAGQTLLGQTATAIGLANIGNTKLRWETTNRLNAGIEGNFFNNRLNLRFNYFKSWTNNLITPATLAYVAGQHDYWTNDGKLENQGFDAAFTLKALNLRDIKIEVGGSIGHYKNEITRLPQSKQQITTDIYNGTILTKVGGPVGLFYGYKTDGVYKDSKAATADAHYITDNAGRPTYFEAGDMRFVDTYTKDGKPGLIDENDRVVIGDPNPDIFGNFFANFHIGKSLTVSANFNYSVGNDVYNFQRSLLEAGNAFHNQTTALNRRWMAEGQVTDIPRSVYNDPMSNGRFSDRWIEDGSYLKLKNVTVSYKIPIQNEYIQGLTVWAAANNLFTISKYLGTDPEVTAGNGVLYQGIDAGYLNFGRSFNLGVKINL